MTQAASGTTKKTKRIEDFPESVRKALARDAMYICSNPGCLMLTGYQTSAGRARAIAQAAHIQAAGKRGPRTSQPVTRPDGTTVELRSAENGIWLCTNCHNLVDQDEARYPSATLLEWKVKHAELLRNLVGRDLAECLLALGSSRTYVSDVRGFLSWLDSHRFMYFDDLKEQPGHVFEAVQGLRAKLTDLRAAVRPGTHATLEQAVESISKGVNRFFQEAPQVDFRTMIVTSGNPEWEQFCLALETFRGVIRRAIAPLAADVGYRFTNIELDDELSD